MSIAHAYRWVQRGVESALYTHQCAWCGARLGEVDATFVRRPDASVRTSHGICPSCSARQNTELERRKQALRTLMESTVTPELKVIA